jgi:pseudouridine synthase
VLARAGFGSRRAVEVLIEQGRVKVNGRTARLGERADPSKDLVEVDGSKVPIDDALVYYLFNKPRGTVTTASDPQGRPTVMDLVDVGVRVWPVGRLDYDTEGALVITNDGDLTQRLTHPRYGVPKTYVAYIQKHVSRGDVRSLRAGVKLEDGIARASSARLLESVSTASLLELELMEGRNRQVRRMLEAVGHSPARLVRVAIGPLMLGRLKPATLRRLGPGEVQALYRAGGE